MNYLDKNYNTYYIPCYLKNDVYKVEFKDLGSSQERYADESDAWNKIVKSVEEELKRVKKCHGEAWMRDTYRNGWE